MTCLLEYYQYSIGEAMISYLIQCSKGFGLTQYFVEFKKRINPAILHQVTVILTEHYTLFLCVNGVLKEIG